MFSSILSAILDDNKRNIKVKSGKKVIYVVQRSPTFEERLVEYFEYLVLGSVLWLTGLAISEEAYKIATVQFMKKISGHTGT